MDQNLSEICQLASEYTDQLPPALPGIFPSPEQIPALIDHTLLKAEATPKQIEILCSEAIQYHFITVCVNSIYVPLAAKILQGSEVGVCCVVGFPLGAMPSQIKTAETRFCLDNGANEVDMVIPIGLLKGGQPEKVLDDILAVVETVHLRNAKLKVILEMAYLNRTEKILGCLLCKAAGADFVKTSTGFGPSGAAAEDVDLMRRVVGSSLGVKAAGGIRTLEQAKTMVTAGANRLGSSSGIAIVAQANSLEKQGS